MGKLEEKTELLEPNQCLCTLVDTGNPQKKSVGNQVLMLHAE